MSGGSYDFVYSRVEQFAGDIRPGTKVRSAGLREWFREHVRLVAHAMHDIEWVDSGDYGDDKECQAIEKVMKHTGSADDVDRKITDALAKLNDEERRLLGIKIE